MNKTKGLYAIKKGNKYLTNLFEDDIKAMFRSSNLYYAYKWNIKAIAENIAEQTGGKVVRAN